jgi:hypothetical protein
VYIIFSTLESKILIIYYININFLKLENYLLTLSIFNTPLNNIFIRNNIFVILNAEKLFFEVIVQKLKVIYLFFKIIVEILVS